MRQVVITKAGPPKVLQVRESPDPSAGPGTVRIRVKAAGINFADLMARLGLYPDAPKIPCVVGYEVSGVIDEVGPGTNGFAVGDRVFGMTRFGGYSDTVVMPAMQAFRMPDKMSFEEAAALPVVYLTAHHMLLYTGSLRPGMKVLIHWRRRRRRTGRRRSPARPRMRDHRHRFTRQARLLARARRPALRRFDRRRLPRRARASRRRRQARPRVRRHRRPHVEGQLQPHPSRWAARLLRRLVAGARSAPKPVVARQVRLRHQVVERRSRS